MPSKGAVHILLVLVVVVVLTVVGFFVLRGGPSQRNHGENITNTIQNKVGCTKPTPEFTVAPTDLDNISLISPPIMRVGSGVKSHSYIETTKPSPVYAPVDSTLTRGAKYTESYIDASKIQYTFFFDVSCDVSYYFDHLINPPEKIADLFPGAPRDTTASEETFSLQVKAGELVGYSWSAQFDFGVLDYTTEPALADFEEYKMSEKAYAVCPMKFFREDLRQNLFDKVGYFDSSDLTVIDNLCD